MIKVHIWILIKGSSTILNQKTHESKNGLARATFILKERKLKSLTPEALQLGDCL